MSTLTASKTRKYTYQDYLLLDDETRYEILEGDLHMTPAPTLDHQNCALNLAVLLRTHIAKQDLGHIFIAPVDVVLNDDNVVQPDIVFVAKQNAHILHKQAIIGCPDLIIEILSPSSIKKDRHDKKALYLEFGIKEYWIVDPANRTIEVFSLEDGHFELHAIAVEKGPVKSKIITDFDAGIDEVF